MFATVLYNLKSPENTGMIVRSHVAFGGEKLVMIGPAPWRFKKKTQAFSRRLEQITDIVYIPDDNSFFQWCIQENFTPVAIEISENPTYLPDFKFPVRPAIVVGNEGSGIPESFLNRCACTLTIPQFGEVACLNTAVSCCIALYEFNRSRTVKSEIVGHRYLIFELGKSIKFGQIAAPDGRSRA